MNNFTLLQINVVANSGSTGRIAEEIGLKAIEHGWNSYIAYGRYAAPSQSHLIKIGNLFDIILHGLQTRFFDKHGLASVASTKRLIKKIEKIKPDVIHIHNIHGYFLNYKILFKYLSIVNIPIVWTLHDCWAYTGHCSYYSSINCFKWKILCFECPNISSYPKSLLLDRSKRNYCDKKQAFNSVENMTIVPVSKWLTEEVKSSFLNKYNLKTIFNGINIEIFKYSSSNIMEKYNINGKFIILGVASVWGERKGLNDFKKLSDKLSDNDIIILVGLTKRQIIQLPSNIIGIEKTENINELAELYSLANVYVNFSIEETFGLTTAESLSCGTPAIVYNATACPEVVSSDTGFVIEPYDIQAVIDAIGVIKKNGKNYYSRACRQRAVERFNKDERCLEYISLYNELLQH